MADRNLPEVYEVEWVDSTISHGWNKPEEARENKPDIITSVGFLVERTDRDIKLCCSATHLSEKASEHHSKFDCITTIPTASVRKTRRLKKERK